MNNIEGLFQDSVRNFSIGYDTMLEKISEFIRILLAFVNSLSTLFN